VVITGALEGWRATSKWTPQFFKERYGTLPLTVNGQHHTLSGFLPSRGGRPITIGEFIDLTLSSNDQNPAPYLRNVHLEKFIPELTADVEPLPDYFSPNWLDGPLSQPFNSRLHGGRCELYIGGRGGRFPVLHWDSWHIYTFLCQIYGIKEYTVFPPDQSKFLYPNGHHSSVDIENVDLNKFPLFAQAEAIKFQLHPGEILFVPPGWWHTQKILTPSITISASRVNASNWNDFSRYLREGAPAPVRPLVWVYMKGFKLLRTLYGC
jgi:histone arginine demethylase JMJD6